MGDGVFFQIWPFPLQKKKRQLERIFCFGMPVTPKQDEKKSKGLFVHNFYKSQT